MQPKIGQVLYINVVSMDEDEEKQLYKSRIADLDDQTICMEVPIHDKTGRLKRLYVGDSLSAHFVTDGGVKNYFNTEVLGFTEETIRLVVIRRPESEAITRVQRRNFLRVPAELEVAVKADSLQFVGLTEDLSGGGFAFLCESHYPLHQHQSLSCWLLMHFRNNQIEHVPFKAEIVRIKPLPDENQLVMLKFTEISEVEQQKIVRYCFERQLDFRKN